MRPAHQRPILPDECLLFVHVPRTAGTSMHAMLAAQFPVLESTPAPLGHSGELRHLPRPLATYRLISGHLPYRTRWVLPRPARAITILREPLSRVYSSYCYQRSRTDEPPADDPIAQLARHASWRTFLETVVQPEPDYWYEFLNTQVAMLLPYDTGVINFHDPASARHLTALACEAIHGLDWIGTLDHLSEQIHDLHEVFGWCPSIDLLHRNASQTQPQEMTDLPQPLLDRVHELLTPDRVLFELAVKLSRERSLALRQERYRASHFRPDAATPSSVRLDLAAPVVGRGWSITSISDEGHPYRKVDNTGLATLDLHVRPSPVMRLEWVVVWFDHANVMERVTLQVNGRTLPHTIRRGYEDRLPRLVAFFPGEWLASMSPPNVRLTLHTPSYPGEGDLPVGPLALGSLWVGQAQQPA